MSTSLARDSRERDPPARDPALALRSPPPSPSGEPAPATGAGRVVANLVLLSLVGVAASIWIWHYTEWFPVIGGLLGMGGVFTWLAFLSGILSAERKAELQELVDRRLLAARWLIGALAAVTLGGAVVAASFGVVVVRSTGDDRDRMVAVTPAGPEAEAGEPSRHHLPPKSALKLPTWVGLGERELLVRVSGLPPQPIVLGRFDRRVLEVPGSFRPGIEIATSGRYVKNLERSPRFELVVLRDGTEIARLEPGAFRGQRAWIGPPPDGLDTTGALVVAPGDPPRRGDRLEVEVRHPDGKPWLVGELVVPAIDERPVVAVELARPAAPESGGDA